MPRPHKADRLLSILPAADARELKRLAADPFQTLDNLRDWFARRGLSISRSGIHAWRRNAYTTAADRTARKRDYVRRQVLVAPAAAVNAAFKVLARADRP